MADSAGINYAYQGVPTLRRFNSSNAYIRGVTGPFGSGKTSACTVEIPCRGREQRRGIDGIRRTRWTIVRNCFDDQTEILTETRGWQFFRDLLSEDRVATLINGTYLMFEFPTYYYQARHNGEMLGLKNQGIDFLVNPNHRLWTSPCNVTKGGKKREWRPFRFEKAIDAYGLEMRRFKRDAEWQHGVARYSEDFYEFLGFWFAEGSAGVYNYGRDTYRFVLVQKKREYVRDLLARAHLKWGESVSQQSGCTYFNIAITPELKPLIRELAALGGARTKRLPVWLRNSPRLHAMCFLKGYVRGDGSTPKARRSRVATTFSRMLADDVQEMALRAGLVVNISSYAVRPSRNSYNKDCAPATAYTMTFCHPARQEPKAKPKQWYKTDYDGMIYCVEVPSHIVYVRRNGRAHWSGQTYRELEDSTIKSFHQWMPPYQFGTWREQQKTYVIRAFEGCEMEVMFRALDKPEDIKKLLSTDLTGAWVNEAREIPWAIIEALQGRIGRYPPRNNNGGPSWFGMWMDTNPPDVDSKWYKFFEEGDWKKSFKALKDSGEPLFQNMKPEEFVSIFRQPSGRSPDAENLKNLPPAYYQRMMVGKSDEWVKVYVDGEYGYVSDDKAVYPEFKDALHIKAIEPVEGRTIYRSWDFGLTPACVLSQVLPDGRWLVFDEICATNMGVERFADQVIEHCGRTFRGSRPPRFEDYGDPSGMSRKDTDEKTCFGILHAKGVDIQPAEQEPTLRWESVRKPMRTLNETGDGMQFVLHPRCKMLRKGFLGGYHFQRLATTAERYSQHAVKNAYCVPLTAEALTPRGWKRHDELSPGDPMYSFDITKRRIVVDAAERVNRFHGRYACVSIDGEFVATDAHRHVARTRAGVIKLLTANGLNDGHSLICAASEDRPSKQRPFSDEFISLAAWVMAEGSYRKTDGAILLCQSNSHNPAYCAYLDLLIQKFPGTTTHKTHGDHAMRTWRIMRETAWALRHWMPDKIPSAEFIAKMCNSNRRRFLYEFLRGDGHAGGAMPDPGSLGSAEKFRPNGVTPRAFQKSKKAVDALQAVATLCGLRSSVRQKGNDGYIITFLASNERFGMQGREKRAVWLNDVWCPTTKAGTWICRQNGRVFITGNSHPHDALQYAATVLFGAGLTMRPTNMDDEFNSFGTDVLDERGRSAVTGY